MLRVSFAAANVTALVAALLYYGLGSSAAVRPVRDRSGSCVRVRMDVTRRCPDRFRYEKTRAEIRREARARTRAARRARTVRSTTARKARIAAAGAAAGTAAGVRARRAAHAWAGGYGAYTHGSGIYYRWVRTHCSSNVDHCWHIKVITHDGCGLLVVEGYETYKRTIVGDLFASRANVPSKSAVLFELIGTSGSTKTQASEPTISCY